jgi:hypothetical protein
LNDAASSSDNCNTPTPTINLFVQYNGFFNKLCAIPLTMTIEDLLVRVENLFILFNFLTIQQVKLRQLTGISNDRYIHLRILSEDGLTTICFLHKENNRTLESYNDRLKDRMILSIEDTDDNKYQRKRLQRSKSTTSSEYNYSFDESDV